MLGIMDYLTLADSATLDTVMRSPSGVMADKLGEAMPRRTSREHGEMFPKTNCPRIGKYHSPSLSEDTGVAVGNNPVQGTTDRQVKTIELLYTIVSVSRCRSDVKKYRALIQDSIAEAGNAEDEIAAGPHAPPSARPRFTGPELGGRHVRRARAPNARHDCHHLAFAISGR